MNGLLLQNIQSIRFGVGTINDIGETILPYGKRILLVTEYPGTATKYVQKIQEILKSAGITPVLFDSIHSGVQTSVIDSIAEIGRAGKIQTVIGLGGMRVLSLARIATAMIGSNIGLNDILKGNLPQTVDCSYIEIPNSCRNHFMLKNTCVIADSVSKLAKIISLPPNLTKAIIIDPQISLGLSRKYQIVAILDTIAASIEGYLSKQRNFISDVCFMEAIRKLRNALLLTLQQDSELQTMVMASEGGLLSCLGLSLTDQGIGGTLSYMINAAFHVPKSWISMVLLPHILDMYEAQNNTRLCDIAEALGEDISNLQVQRTLPRAAAIIRRFLARLELPGRLRDFNLSLEELYTICDISAQFPLTANGGLELDSTSISELIKKSF